MKWSNLSNEHSRVYKEYKLNENTIKTRISKLESKIEWNKKQLDKVIYPHWMRTILEPLAEEIIKLLPGRQFETLGPFGLKCETSIHFNKENIDHDKRFEDGNCISLTFVPGDIENGELLIVDHTKNTKRYPPGTLGEMNGMNYPGVKIPDDADAQWFIDWMKKQMEAEA